MPLTAKGEKIKAAMMKNYGAKKGKQVFYASENKGSITGVKIHGASVHEQVTVTPEQDTSEVTECDMNELSGMTADVEETSEREYTEAEDMGKAPKRPV